MCIPFSFIYIDREIAQDWYFVTKIVLTYYQTKLFY